MEQQPSRMPARISLAWLAANAAVLLAIPFRAWWDMGEARALLGMGVLVLWPLTPIVGAAAIVWRLRFEAGPAWALLVTTAALFGYSTCVYLWAGVFSPDPQSPIAFVFLPVLEWLALLVTTLVILVVRRITQRRSAPQGG